MRINMSIICFMLLVVTSGIASAKQLVAPTLRYVDAKEASRDAQIIDTRALAMCQQRSIVGAHCLPASDLFGPGGVLPSFVDIYWALGTAGISAHRRVLVTGDQARERDFVAGLLYLCGQASIQVLTTPIDAVLQKNRWPSGQGQPRGNFRLSVYDATMRDELIVFPTELAHALTNHKAVVPIDGRNLSIHRGDEYLAGHIPGAMQLPRAYLNRTGSHLRLTAISKETTPAKHRYFVAYAHVPMDSIALFTRLRADEINQRVDIRVMPAGWQGWTSSRRKANIND